jgi:hypothetical protein
MRPRNASPPRPRTVRCRYRNCKAKLHVKAKGPLPLYCRKHRQAVYLERRHAGPMVVLAQDIATAKIRDVIRTEVWRALSEWGFNVPPPPEKKRKHNLRIVSD